MDDSSWLSSLPSHPIFKTLSSADRSVTRSYSFAASEGQLLPPSPDASSIHDILDGEQDGDQDADSTTQSALGNGSGRRSEKRKAERRRSVGCIARKTDLIVAAGSQLRLASLAHVKTRSDTARSSGASSSGHSYKVSLSKKEIERLSIVLELVMDYADN